MGRPIQSRTQCYYCLKWVVVVVGIPSCGYGEEQAPGKPFLVRTMVHLSCRARAPLEAACQRACVSGACLPSCVACSPGWRIDSLPYSFQLAGDDVLFQLSIGSAVIFFLCSFPSPFLVLEMEPRALSIGYTFSTIEPPVLCICSVLCLLANAHFSPHFLIQLECM